MGACKLGTVSGNITFYCSFFYKKKGKKINPGILMNQRGEKKPVLQGQRIKTRKRDEKEKYDPNSFRDAIILGLVDTKSDLEQVSKFLDKSGNSLDYRRYAETLLDILFAGGILAPGGSIQEEGDDPKLFKTDISVFKAKDDFEVLKAHYEIFFKLIRRYKYLERFYQDEMKKLVVFLRGFSVEERRKLGTVYGISLANGLGNADCLAGLFEEHLVKDAISMSFATDVFTSWLKLKDINHLASTLKRAGIESKLMHLLPLNKRTQENFDNHFISADLKAIVEFQKAKANSDLKKELYKLIEDHIDDEESVNEMVVLIKNFIEKNAFPEHDAVTIVWSAIMNSVEWNKKEEVIAEQSMKHLKVYAPVLAACTTSGRSEMTLLNKIQDYCYGTPGFGKLFGKIVISFYKVDVLGEDVLIKWFKDGKGKADHKDQIKKLVEWLLSAEEESEEEED